MAAVLGLKATAQPEPSLHPSETAEGIEPRGRLTDESWTAPIIEPAPLIDVPFWRLEAVEYLHPSEPEERGVEPLALPEWTERPPAATPQPLARWQELLPRLRHELARTAESRDPDVPAIVHRLGRGDSLRRLPYRWYRCWGETLHIIEDRSDRLTPYWRDQAMVRQRLMRLFPRHAVRQALIDEGLDRPLFVGSNRGADRRYRLPPPGGTVLVLGDLGCLARDDPAVRASWEQLGRSLAEADCRAVALLPLPTAQCPPGIRRYWHLLAWERGPGVLDPEHWTQQIESLLCLLSPTSRVEPGLLRDVRRIAGLDAAAESLVWQHPALISTSSVAATLGPEDLKRRRAEFKAQARSKARVCQQVLERIRAWRAHLPAEIYYGEGALLDADDADSQALLPAGDRELFQRFFVALSDQICGVGGAVAPRGAAEWFLRFEQRSTKQEPIWGVPAVHRLWEAVHRHDEHLTSPPGFEPEGIGSDPGRPVTAVAIRQEGASLVFTPHTRSHRGSSSLGGVTTRNGLIQIEALAAFWTSCQPPLWAEDWGTDAYGPWVTFSIEDQQGHKVTQRLRWIAPGTFLMGSPQDEPERYNDEGPQHQVALSRGFWLFDTACPQVLWQAVMGENRSGFKGSARPVENVSWNDCQEFIRRLNQRLPGLDLTLPSEAQWEYACRAGTTTPFSFGANITPEQVNYDGNHPYAGGAKGRYRQETVPVGSLPPNPWGLYEMHGNVWEWTQDHWHDDYQGAPADGSAWEDRSPGALRVVRGGSWRGHARLVRAAVRVRYPPGYRIDSLGFRCARVQAREPGRPGAEPAAPAAGRPAERRPAPGQPSTATGAEQVESRLEKPFSPRERGKKEGDQTGRWAGAPPILLRLDIAESQARCAVPRASAFLIHTDLERLTFGCFTKPAWARAIGRDRYGLWTEIALDSDQGQPVTQRLRWIPPGRFRMGSPESEHSGLAKEARERGWFEPEGPQHQVTLTQGYWLFDTPCTQALWQAVMGDNPSRFQSPDRPVEQVSWEEVQRFLGRINDRVPELGLVLPSKAQWEYACRAGTETALYTGDLAILGANNAPALDPIAWYGGNSGVDFDLDNGEDSSSWPDKQYPHERAGTHPVGRKQPNAWGLYDMLGNVWEWCRDGLRDYHSEPVVDPVGPEDPGAGRVFRGGSWNGVARHVRAASRGQGPPGGRSDALGFRCARVQA